MNGNVFSTERIFVGSVHAASLEIFFLFYASSLHHKDNKIIYIHQKKTPGEEEMKLFNPNTSEPWKRLADKTRKGAGGTDTNDDQA